jgi:hypothetical protein
VPYLTDARAGVCGHESKWGKQVLAEQGCLDFELRR